MITDPQYIDLHLHSNYSDGALSPSQLVERAGKLGLKAIAIADHDTVSGVAESFNAAAEIGMVVIAAVELSVSFKVWQDVHLLGYGLNFTDHEFLNKLNNFRDRRERRNIEILSLINQRLVDEKRDVILLKEVLGYARGAIGRPHIARALIQRQYVSSVEDAFRRYLIPCNVPKHYWSIHEAISEIKRLGGLAVLAHPTSVTANREQLRGIIHELRELGLDGIEVYNNQAQVHEMEFLRRIAEGMGLAISAGSDFHGIEDGLEIGRGRGGMRFSATLLAPLLKRLLERQNQLLSL